MKTITVELESRSYPIHVSNGLLQKLPDILKEQYNFKSCVLISQPAILKLFTPHLQSSVLNYHKIIIPPGEQAKDFNEYRKVISQMIEMGCDRSWVILALGGGVVGDLAGFAAATFMRGINYFQIPTTLLAMVDSAIGGKTGLNLPEGKNLIGAFHQPQAVFIDPTLLTSLPRKEVISGLAEIIKYGAIRDRDFLSWIASNLDEINHFPYESAIAQSCSIKAQVVSLDEHEGDLRRILNFGHTIGHALEAYLGYGNIRHGEAVAYGMICATWISQQLGYLRNTDYQFLTETIMKLPLPTLLNIESTAILDLIQKDKKMQNGVLNFVILDGLGKATTSTQVPDELIVESLTRLI